MLLKIRVIKQLLSVGKSVKIYIIANIVINLKFEDVD